MNRILPCLGLIAICGFSSCETNDVEDPKDAPLVTLSSDAVGIIENLGSTVVRANLASPAISEVIITFSITGTASASDYVLDANEIIISAGDSTGSISITATQDELEEGNETVTFTIETATNATVDGVETLQLTIEDDDVAQVIQLVLNEVLYDPSNSGLDGDANGDGTYAQAEDEFLEFVNGGIADIDLSGYTIFDTENLSSNTPNHTFPAGSVLASGKAIVVFGGGTPTGTFGGAIVQTSTTGDFNMNNSGDEITLKNAEGEVVMTFDIEPLSNNPNESYTRFPDLTGEFDQHSNVASTLFSPGTKADGSPF
jgi:hypothetical protein